MTPDALRDEVERRMRKEAQSNTRHLCLCDDRKLCVEHSVSVAVEMLREERKRARLEQAENMCMPEITPSEVASLNAAALKDFYLRCIVVRNRLRQETGK